MMPRFTILCAALLLSGCGTTTLPECEFTIEGEPYQWEGMTLHSGRLLKIDGHTLELPDEVNEMHCNAWRADFNGDGEPDYLLSVAGMGNGKNFGDGVLYILLSQSGRYRCLKQEYGGFAP